MAGGDRQVGDPDGADSKGAMVSVLQCSHCKRVFSESKGWQAPEADLATRDDLTVSHGICPDCLKRHFPEFS